MTEIRNILLIGRTGNGKSTLANTLVNKNEEFEEVFKESSGSTSETKEIQKGEFKMKINDKEIKYQVIDTVGIGDTQLSPREVLNRVADACQEIKDGLNQIFFVIKGRFVEEELEAYNVLRTTVFDEKITDFTTIVRTGFVDFDKEEACAIDREKINNENPSLAELIKSCNKLIYVDNSPIPVDGRTMKIVSAKEDRKLSRRMLLKHLVNDCGNYRPSGLDKLNERISSYMTEKEKLQKRLEELEKESKKEKSKTEAERKKAEVEMKKTQSLLKDLEAKFEEQAKKLNE